MSKILITTFGTTGDLNPFLALAIGLRARGHDITFAVEDNYRDALAGTGFDKVYPLSGEIDPSFTENARQLYRSSVPFRSVQAMVARYIVPTLQTKVEDLLPASAGADLIVAPSEQFAASIVSDLTGIPWATVNLSSVSIPSAYVTPHPWPIALPSSLQPVANRLQWGIGTAALRWMADRPINAVRAGYGLPPVRNQLTTGNLSHSLAAIATSPAFLAPQPDWPSHLLVTGFCFWDTPRSWSESSELKSFLDGSQPVVAVSSGSISPRVGGVFERFYRDSIEAVRKVGARALVVGTPASVLPESLPEDVLALPFVPFSQVYPRCSAVIHHGGIGTTAQGLRAGVPALVVPWGFDQFFTAAQVARIGVGRWMSRRSYAPHRVAKALEPLLDSGSTYRRRSRFVAAQIAQEDGVGNLCRALETLLLSELSVSPGYGFKGGR